jgi:hypothetical protein
VINIEKYKEKIITLVEEIGLDINIRFNIDIKNKKKNKYLFNLFK